MLGKVLLKPFAAKFATSHIAIALGCFCLAVEVEPADAQRGIPAIVGVCAPCHGADGTGGDVEKPNLAGQKSIYIRQQLEAFRAGRRKHPEMKSFARELTNREIDQLVVYYSTLSPP
jgi:cytochrome c553